MLISTPPREYSPLDGTGLEDFNLKNTYCISSGIQYPFHGPSRGPCNSRSNVGRTTHKPFSLLFLLRGKLVGGDFYLVAMLEKISQLFGIEHNEGLPLTQHCRVALVLALAALLVACREGGQGL